MYPEADEVDWRYKGQNKERLVRVLYLVDPNMDLKDLWQKYETMYDDEDDDKCGKKNLHTFWHQQICQWWHVSCNIKSLVISIDLN